MVQGQTHSIVLVLWGIVGGVIITWAIFIAFSYRFKRNLTRPEFGIGSAAASILFVVFAVVLGSTGAVTSGSVGTETPVASVTIVAGINVVPSSSVLPSPILAVESPGPTFSPVVSTPTFPPDAPTPPGPVFVPSPASPPPTSPPIQPSATFSPVRPPATSTTVRPSPTRVTPSTPVATATPTSQVGVNNAIGPSLPKTTLLVFADEIASGWLSNSWDSTIDWTNTQLVYTGTKSISWTPDKKWAGLDFHSGAGQNIAGYSKFHFAMRPSMPGEQFSVVLHNPPGKILKAPILLANYGGDPVTGSWKRYDIPLADLGIDKDHTTITDIAIQESQGNAQPTVYVDEVGFY